MGGIWALAEQEQSLCLLQQRRDSLNVPRGLEARTQGRDIGGEGSADIMRLLACHRMVSLDAICMQAFSLGKGCCALEVLQLSHAMSSAVVCIRCAID